MSLGKFETVTLAEVSINNKGEYGIGASAVDYSDELYTYLRITDINDDGTLNKNDLKSVDDDDAKNYLLNENDVVFARTGNSTGKAYYYDKMDGELVYAGFLIKFSLDPSKINPKFMKYYVLSEEYKGWVNSMCTGSTRPNINAKMYGNMELILPPREQQDFLVNSLEKIDKKIEINKRINKNLEGLAKSIYRYHFIDFKPYSQDNFKSTTIGEIPENWSVQSIEDFVDDMKNGGTPKRGESDYWKNGTVPWLKTGEINNNIIIKSEEHITKLGLKNSSAKLLPVNSIIMALYGTGTAARIGLLKLEATTNQACCAMICNDFNKTLFLYLFLLFNQKEIENLASGSVQQNLSKDLIANLKLVVPPIEIIDNLPFKEIFDTIANNYFEIEYLTNLRDTLLPKLMSGEMDISKINCDLKIIIIKFILNPLKYLWRYLNENKDYIQNTKSNETLLKSRPIYKINKFFTKFTSRYRNYRQ